MILPASDSDRVSSRAYETFHPRVQQWIFRQQWGQLRDAQEHAAPAILAGDQDLLVGAATASGKTEAAWLPICSALLVDAEHGRSRSGVQALYVSPLKALINDQYDRLTLLCTDLDLPVHRWHGDVAGSRKSAVLRSPAGILLITPESLEALFVTGGTKIGGILGALRYIVIDEFHSFIGTERGAQLQSLLHRIDLLTRYRVPRIALSATLGDFDAAASFLRPGAGDAVQRISSDDESRELRLQLRGYLALDPAKQRPKVTDSPPQGTSDDPTGEADADPWDKAAIADHLFRTLRGKDNLVFARSRGSVEEYSDMLDRRSRASGVPNEFLPHHGNLSKDLREHVEARLKDSSLPITAICTSTLEMGIDIGSVHSVAQIGTPPSVASLRQRLGRSGRRGEEPAILRLYVSEPEVTAKTPPSDLLRSELVQTIAMIDLLLEKWYEPPDLSRLHLSTLIQQILSVIAQRSGARADALYSALCTSGPFARVDRQTFVHLLHTMGAADLIIQSTDGLLLPGPTGERMINHYSFYTAFHTAEEYRLVTGGRTIGSLPIDFPVIPGTLLIFGGRRWKVLGIHPDQKVIELIRSAGGRPPHFSGSSGEVADEVRRRMLSIYASTEIPTYLDRTAQALLLEGRESFERHQLAHRPIVGWGKDVVLFPFRGDRIMNTLAVVFDSHGIEIGQDAVALTLRGTDSLGLWHLIRQLARTTAPAATMLAAGVRNKERDKHDRFLGKDLLDIAYAAGSLDVGGAWDTLRRLADTSPPEPSGFDDDGPNEVFGAVGPDAPHGIVELGRTPFAVVDVETTGLAPHRGDRIVEIAVVRVSPSGAVEKVWTTVIDPECDPGPTHIHGLSSGQLAGAPRFADIADELAAQLDGTVVVAHNARFDMSFLEAEFLRAGREPPLWPLLCTLELADFLGSGGARRLQDCCAAEGIIADRTHEALADATATAQLLGVYLRRALQQGLDLQALGCEPLEIPPALRSPRPAIPRTLPRQRAAWPQAPSRNRAEHAFGLVGIIARAQVARTGDTRGDAYLEVLDRALEDGTITDEEGTVLREVASGWGLTPQRVSELHTHYIDALALAFTARQDDDTPDPGLRHQLDYLAAILGNGEDSTGAGNRA